MAATVLFAGGCKEIDPCVSSADCDDNDACTLDICEGGVCFPTLRACEEEYQCNAATGRCEDAKGDDPCVGVVAACNPAEMLDYETSLHRWDNAVWCAQDLSGWQVGGVCNDGTLFVYGSDTLHREVQYFNPESRGFLAWVFQSDAFDCNCLGIFYCPELIDCTVAEVMEVACGTEYAEGDTIILPGATPWYEDPDWEFCVNDPE